MLYYLYSLIFFLPFERIPSVEYGGITIRITTLLLIGGLVILLPILAQKKQIFPLSPLDKTVLIFASIAILSSLQADQHDRSFKVLLFLAATMVGYLLTSRILRKQFASLHLLRVIVISGTLTALFGLYQFIGDGLLNLSLPQTGLASQYSKIVFGFPRVQSVGLEPLYFANFLLLPLFFLIIFLAFSNRKARSYELISLIIMLTAFFLALSRGAYGAFGIGGIALLAWFWISKTKLHNVLPIILCMAAALCFSYLGVRASAGSKGINTFTSHAAVEPESRGASVAPRLANYHEAWRLFLNKPILGVGIGNYGVVNKVSPPSENSYMIVNNQYLETLAETGIIGLLGLVWILTAAFLAIYRVLRSTPWLGLSLGIVLISILVQYNFFSTIYLLILWILLGLIEAASFRSERGEPLVLQPKSPAKE